MASQPEHAWHLTRFVLVCLTLLLSSAALAAPPLEKSDAGAPADSAALRRGEYYAHNHDGRKKDYGLAMSWFRKAAAAGDVEAYYLIGEYYEDGRSVSQDYSKAKDWYCAAAMRGNPAAQAALGGFYEHGFGVSKDEEQAYYWFGLAAMSGNEDYVRERDHIVHRLRAREVKYIQRYLGLWAPGHLTADTVFGGCPLPSDRLPE